MIVQLDLSEMYSDGEGTIGEEIIDRLIHRSVNEIQSKLKEQHEDVVLKKAKEIVEKTFYRKMAEKMSSVFKRKKIKLPGRFVSDDTKTLNQHIEYLFSNYDFVNDMHKKIEDVAKKELFSIKKKAEADVNDIRNRFDLMYASQIVLKLNEQGLLKEGVVESLIQN